MSAHELTCPGCGGKAVFAEGYAFGSYQHRPGCKYDLEAQIMAKQKRFTNVSLHREITRDVHEHEIFMAFHNDEDAAFFDEWWNGEGAVLFQKFVDKREIEEQ